MEKKEVFHRNEPDINFVLSSFFSYLSETVLRARFLALVMLVSTIPARVSPHYLPFIHRWEVFDGLDPRHGLHDKKMRAREVTSRRQIENASATETDGNLGGQMGQDIATMWRHMYESQGKSIDNSYLLGRTDIDGHLREQQPTQEEAQSLQQEPMQLSDDDAGEGATERDPRKRSNRLGRGLLQSLLPVSPFFVNDLIFK